MRWLLGLLAATTLALSAAPAQDPAYQLYTNPSTPPREALDRLNLTLGWRAYVPVQGRRDGILTAQLVDGELYVQTRMGMVIKLDAETGREQWRNVAGTAFKPTHELGFNKTAVFVVSGTWLFAMDRATGRQLWEYNLPSAPSAAPAADDKLVYLSLGSGHIYTYRILGAEVPKAAPPAGPAAAAPAAMGSPGNPSDKRPSIYDRGSRTVANIGPLGGGVTASLRDAEGPQPLEMVADKVTPHFLEKAPLQTEDRLLFACADGGALAIAKGRPIELYYFPTQSMVTAAPTQHGNTAYLGSHDSVTALSVDSGRALWRFTAPSPVLRKPAATDDSLYVTPQNWGLHRLDRANGDLLWANETAGRFLAANNKFVYAADRKGQLMVLDKARGTTLSSYDTRDFVWLIPNEETDRVYLAANNGLIVCLHDREYVKPLVTKYAPPPKPPEKPADKPPDNPPMEGGDKPKP